MPPAFAAGNTDVSNYARDPTAWNEDSATLFPNPVQLIKELLVILDVPHLIRVLLVSLQMGIRRARHDEMHRLVIDMGKVAGVALVNDVLRLLHEAEHMRPHGRNSVAR
jgi:hypothetical protein